MQQRYALALIPCTAKKRPEGRTPATLYMGGPFSLMMRHAQQRCDAVIIMSALYGLLRLSDPVSYYDAYIPDLDAEERTLLIGRIRGQTWVRSFEGQRICSYLPQEYYALLAEALPELAKTIRRPYAGLPSLVMFRHLSNEIQGYGSCPSRR